MTYSPELSLTCGSIIVDDKLLFFLKFLEVLCSTKISCQLWYPDLIVDSYTTFQGSEKCF